MLIHNAFSQNMLPSDHFAMLVTVARLTERQAADEAKACAEVGDLRSAVGHADTAALFSTLLGVEVPFNRTSVTLAMGEFALVGQYSGPRLPEGTTVLPEGANVEWLMVGVVK